MLASASCKPNCKKNGSYFYNTESLLHVDDDICKRLTVCVLFLYLSEPLYLSSLKEILYPNQTQEWHLYKSIYS